MIDVLSTAEAARADVVGLMLGGTPVGDLIAGGRIAIAGDRTALARLTAMLDMTSTALSPVLPS